MEDEELALDDVQGSFLLHGPLIQRDSPFFQPAASLQDQPHCHWSQKDLDGDLNSAAHELYNLSFLTCKRSVTIPISQRQSGLNEITYMSLVRIPSSYQVIQGILMKGLFMRWTESPEGVGKEAEAPETGRSGSCYQLWAKRYVLVS